MLIHKICKKLFNDKYTFIPGEKYFSIQLFQADNDIFTIDLQSMDIQITLSSIISFSNKPIVSFTFEKLHINIKKIPTTKKNDKALTYVQWAWKKIGTLFFTLIFHRAFVNFLDFKISFKDATLEIESLLLYFKRTKEGLNSTFSTTNIIISYKEPFLRLPALNFVLFLNDFSLTYLFSTFISSFAFSLNTLQLQLKDGELSFEVSTIKIENSNDKNVNGYLHIPHFIAMIPPTTINTKNIGFTITDINFSTTYGNTGTIIIKRAEDPIVRIPSISYKFGALKAGLVDVHLSTSLLLDLAMFYQLLPHTPLDVNNPQRISIPFDINVDQVRLDIKLSEQHLYKLDGSNMHVSGNSVSFKDASAVMVVKSSIEHRAVSVTKLNVTIISEAQFIVRAKTFECIMSNEFAFLAYMLASVRIIKYIQYTMKGPDYQIIHSIPQTPFDVSLECHECTVKLLKRPLFEEIERTNEAKRIAMEGLQIRQAKAMQILAAKSQHSYNEEEFEQKSKEILFGIFKNVLEETEPCPSFMLAKIIDLNLHFDGLAFPTFESAVEAASTIYPNSEPERIGEIDAGKITATASKIRLDANRHKGFMKLGRSKLEGIVCIVSKRIDFRKDLFYYQADCDGGTLSLLTPDCTQSSVNMFKGSFNTRAVSVLWSPSIDEFVQDTDFALLNATLKAFKYCQVKSFDTFRIENHVIGTFTADRLKVKYNTDICPFDPEGLAVITFPRFTFKYENDLFDIGASGILVEVLLQNHLQRFLKMPPWAMRMTFDSVNELGEVNNPPMFIDIDSSRLMDDSYDPFSEYRTVRFNVGANVTFSTKRGDGAAVNFDLIQPIIDEILMSKVDRFSKAPEFILLKKPKPIFNSGRLNLQLPSIDIQLLGGEYIVQMNSGLIDISFTNGVVPSFSIDCSTVDAICSNLGQNLGVIGLRKMIYDTADGNSCLKITELNADIHQTFVQMLLKIHINMPPSNKPKPKAPVTLNAAAIDRFASESIIDSVEFEKINMNMIGQGSFAPNFSLDGALYTTFANQEGEEVKAFKFKQLTVRTSSFVDFPLMTSENLNLWFALDEKRASVFLDMSGSTAFHIRPQDFDMILGQMKELMPAAMKPRLEEKSGTKLAMSVIASIEHSLMIRFMRSDEAVLASVIATGFDIEYSSAEDGRESTSCTLQHIEVTDEEAKDDFRVALQTIGHNDPQFEMRMQVGKKTMKCPVFNLINIKLTPFYLRVSMKFIDNMIKFFPSTNDLNIFDLDSSDIDGQPSKPAENQVYIGKSGDENDLVGFYRRINLEPFVAIMSYRFAPDMLIHEILSRKFIFEKIELTDTFGTKEQLKNIVKKELKWTLIKAFPKMLVKARI